MFGLVDRLYLRRHGYGNPDFNGFVRSRISVRGDPKCLWMIFLPASLYDKKRYREKSILPDSLSVVYRIPQDLITQDPKEIRGELGLIYNYASSLIEFYERSLGNIGTIGISLGTSPATKLANKYFQLITKLRLVAPGSNLISCIREGRFTSRIYEDSLKNGTVTEQDWIDNLDEYSPINNLNKLSETMEIDITLGRFDDVVPYRYGRELVMGLRERGLEPNVNEVNILGHSFTPNIWGHGVTITKFRNKN